MPCSSGMDPVRVEYKDGYDPAIVKQLSDLANKHSKMKTELDKVTALLCAVGRARKHKTDIPPEVLNWWDEHCKIDAIRGEPW